MQPPPAPASTADDLRALARSAFPPTIIDVRRRAAFDRDPVRLPMALRREPEAVEHWAGELEAWRPVIAYCVHGHEVSQNAAAVLRARGLDARSLEGGIEGWRESGGPIEPWASAHALGDARATQDRSHRLPVARAPLRRCRPPRSSMSRRRT